MKKPIRYLLLLICLVLFGDKLFAQAPNISYSPSTVTYYTTIPITTLIPSNSGGAPEPVYTSTATFATVGSSVTCVATDDNNNVYTTDYGHGKIYAYNSAGVGGTINTTTTAGPQGIIADHIGNIYVSDLTNKDVYQFNATTGALTGTVTGFTTPLDLACDASNNIYAIDAGGAGSIVKIAAGTLTKTTLLTGLGTSIYGVAVSGNDLFFSQTALGTVVKVANGLTGSTAQTTFASGFTTPRYLTADGSGNIYVADLGHGLIQEITSGGAVSSLINTGGTPRDVAINSYGVIYIAISSTSVVTVSSNLYTVSPALPAGLSLDPNTGNITGTPTAISAAANYTITAHNTTGTSAAVVNITVTLQPPIISYSQPTVSWKVNTAVGTAPNTATVLSSTGGAIASFAISPMLPAGLSFSTSTGAITGTPTASSAATDYTITATNTGGTGQAIVNINCFSAYVWNGSSSVTWATATNWTPNTVPSAGDQVSIGTVAAAHYPAIVANTNLSMLTLGNTGGSSSGTLLTISNGITLTVTGDITYQNSSANTTFNATITGTGTAAIVADNFNVTNTATTGAATPITLTSTVPTVTLSGDIVLTPSHGANAYNTLFVLSSGAATTDGIVTNNVSTTLSTFTAANSTTVNFTGADPFSGITGSTSNNAITFGTSGTTTNIGYTGSNNQNINNTANAALSYSFVNLTLSGSGTKTLASALTVGGTLTNGTGVTLSTTSGLLTVTGTTANTGTITNTSTGGVTFTGVVTNNTGGTITQNAASGTAMKFSAIPSNSGLINQTNAGPLTFVVGVTNNSGGNITQDSAPGGTMLFTTTLANTGTVSQTTANTGGITFTGIITNNAAGILTFNGGTATITATFTNSGTINQTGGGTVTFNNTFANAKTVSLTGTGGTMAFTLTSTTAFTNNASSTFNATAGAVTFTGAAQTITNSNTTVPVAFNDVTFGGSGTKTLAGAQGFTSAGTVTMVTAVILNATTATYANNGTFNGSTGTITFGVAFTNGSGANFNSGTGASGLIKFSSTTNNSGTITNTSTGGVTFTGIVTNNSAGIITQNAASGTMLFSAVPANSGLINETNAGLVKFNVGVTNNSGATITQDSAPGGTMTFNTTLANTGLVNQTSANTGGITFTGIITNNAAGVLTFGGGTATVSAAFTNSGTVNQSGGTITFPLVSATAFTNNASPAVFTSTGGTVTFSGGGNQTITNSNTTTPVTFNNLNLSTSGTKTLAGNKFVILSSGVITLSTSSTTIFNPGAALLTLNSNATGSASLATLPTGTSITTAATVNVQRFITGNNSLTYRGYRLLSSAINDSDVGGTGYWDLSFLADGSSYLTGAAGGVGVNGFNVAGNPTLYLYRDDVTPDNSSFTTGNYRAITQINNSSAFSLGTIDGTKSLPVGTGVMYFYRGNASQNASIAPSDHAFTMTGPLNTGSITVKYWYTPANSLDYTAATGNSAVEGYNLVGNPYPSTIDWETFNTTSSTTGIYSAASTSTTIYTINPSSHVYATYMQGGGSTNGGSQYIASGQGFFVQATASGAQLIFNESAKASVQPPTLQLSSNLVAIADQHLRLKLVQDSVNAEDIYLGFRATASSAYVFNEDAPYLVGNGTVSLSSSSSDNRQLAINFQPLPKQSLVIPLNTNVNDFGIFKMNLTEAVGIPPVYDIWLQDTYLKDSLDIRHNPIYSFSVTTDPASYNHSRFNLVIRQNPALAVHLLSFAGVKENSDVKLVWTVENEAVYTHYTLQRSTDGGKSFITIDTLTSAALGTYTDLDLHPVTGANLYRLEQVDVLGNITYSSVVTIMYAPQSSIAAASLMTIYPNPVSTTLNLAITQPTNATTTTYAITIVNSTGTVVKNATSAQPSWQGNLSGISPGTYFIRVVNTTNNALIGVNTFVKK